MVGFSSAALLLTSVAAAAELRTNYLQSLYFSRKAGELTFAVQPGANDGVRFPVGGPQDQRLGYCQASCVRRFAEERATSPSRQQSVPSPELAEFIGEHGYAVYREKEVAGLTLHDRDGAAFYKTGYPQHLFGNFDSIPPADREHAPVHRGPLAARQRPSAAESRDSVASLCARCGRAGWRRAGSKSSSRRRQHARDPDREVPALPGRPHPRRRGQAQPDGGRLRCGPISTAR